MWRISFEGKRVWRELCCKGYGIENIVNCIGSIIFVKWVIELKFCGMWWIDKVVIKLFEGKKLRG